MEISELTEAERRVWEAFPRGDAIDFRTSGNESATEGADWGPERTVRAEVLRALLLDGTSADGQVASLRVRGARVVGQLNLLHGTVTCALSLLGCHLDSAPLLFGAQLRRLYLSKCVMPGLHAGTLRVDGDLSLMDCRISGVVRMHEAKISGSLYLNRAQLGQEGAEPDEPVLQLNRTVIGDALHATELVTYGRFRIDGATVGGSVVLTGARLSNPGEDSLQAEGITVGSDLLADGMAVRGRINLRGGEIPGRMVLSYGRLSNPGGTALRASSCTIGELWLRAPLRVEGSLNLRRSRLDLLHIAPESWPAQVQLDGLTYTALGPHEPAERRLPLLERETDGYVPHAYEQLAAAYRRIGDDAAVRTVQLAKQRRHRATLAWYGKAWGHLQDITVGYGFRPTRAAAWLLSLLLIGAVTYAIREPLPLKADEAPHFNPVFYTLDLLLPIVDFGQERHFSPDNSGLQWLAYALVIMGWILATTIVAGVTRSVSRQ
ncbi:membrane-associated oxidoreductase [Streptomyces sp. NBC_01304]|uniref:membrane-associated oxidoreductase n=1 Tax=Streptomyces sp. NBC_01304 TaxID=2903818 RepID=UPI002E126D14|nr:membrane-associated oxidoreductase [Streptomyces sp. NBC_01304]